MTQMVGSISLTAKPIISCSKKKKNSKPFTENLIIPHAQKIQKECAQEIPD